LSFFLILWKRLTVPAGTLSPPKVWTCIVSFFFTTGTVKKAHGTIWNPTPTKSVSMYFVVFFYYSNCEKGSWCHLEPYPHQKCEHVLFRFFTTMKKAHDTIWNPTPTKNVSLYICRFFFYCEKGSRYHLEPYPHQKCEHVFCRFFGSIVVPRIVCGLNNNIFNSSRFKKMLSFCVSSIVFIKNWIFCSTKMLAIWKTRN